MNTLLVILVLTIVFAIAFPNKVLKEGVTPPPPPPLERKINLGDIYEKAASLSRPIESP
jgi:hypothetical protein